ncbi:hypothetical protein ACH474_10815 [Nocardia rhamnosiphila]|uniref:hypothetical protein n=1 Tax=Nocardia rhamnosiphila TaxID=426716 RepID=UPI0033D9AD03
MGTTVNQDPDDLRGRGDQHVPVADAYLAGAKSDPEWEGSFLERAGYGASSLLAKNQAKARSRIQLMTGYADTHMGARNVSHSGATTFEGADTDGAAGAGSVDA